MVLGWFKLLLYLLFSLPSLDLEMSNKSSGTSVSPNPRNVNLDELRCAETAGHQRSESNYFPAEN